ncbi:Vacuolar protein-sorting-associated protein 27 [Kappamyces sp. JEL0680]|nr:Vacuolar protein-sorting-associated protein 27 [Kappamyces sp. JEL0680]
MSILSLFSGSSYEKEIAQATGTETNVNGQVNYATLLDIADFLKSGKWNAKTFCSNIVKRFQDGSENGNILLNTLALCDVCVKNAGASFLACFSTREMTDQLAALSRDSNAQVRQKAREYIQTWALLVKGNQDMFMLQELYENLKRIGVDFPAVSVPIATAFVETTLVDRSILP